MVMVVLQILVPLALVGWLAAWPATSWLGLGLQGLGTGLVLLALWRVALWGVPPRWVIAGFGVIWLLAAACALWRLAGAGAPLWPRGTAAWTGLAIAAGLAGLGGAAATAALWSALPPQGQVVELGVPLGPGHYLVAHGGRREITNVHLKTLDPGVPRFADWRGQSFAVDYLGLGRFGFSHPPDLPPDPATYPIFGAPVVAPCAGRVVAARDGLPDMRVPRMDSARKLGNHVILDCGGVWVVLAHLRRGSVGVAAGAHVGRGAALAEVGNSGNSSQPHLHLHAQSPGRAGAPAAGVPLPIRVNGGYPVRNDVLVIR